MTYNLFGTDGIRATVGTQPLTREQLAHRGTAIARGAQKRYGGPARIALAHDTRASCHFVKAALQSGLLSYSLTIFDMHVLPTPALCYLIQRTSDFDCGIVISASHNPYQDNGIKIITRDGKISVDDECYISKLFYEQSEPTYNTLGSTVILPEALPTYCAAISQFFAPNFLQGKKIVLDCANGATSIVAPTLFKQFGASIVVIHNQPDGFNINTQCGALYLNDLQQAVTAHQADVGFAFDGDGDRIIAVNRQGVIKNGDDILALLLEHPLYSETKAVVGTSMTNHGLASLLTERNKQLLRTNVGEKYVQHQPIAGIIAKGNAQLHSGRLVIRYSGTEHLLRIMIEDKALENAQQIGKFLSEALQKELSTA